MINIQLVVFTKEKETMALNDPGLKKIVAERAVNDYVKDGMTVGLGTGTTSEYAVRRIAELIKEGFKLKCVATSQRTADLAQTLGIVIYDIDRVDHIDVT
ncbi:MAG: hypothetical protein LBP82_03440, partial [Candidatus Methanoplasma sp.]|nr:hypothetical protein [Candidatus Methanoplasma sp.]